MTRTLAGSALPLAVLVVWQIAAGFDALPEHLPPPSAIGAALWELLRTGELVEHLAISLYRAALGLALGAATGVCAGMAAGLSVHVNALLAPLVSALNPIPKIAFLPLIIVALGLGDGSKIAAIALSVFFPTFLAAYYAVRSVPRTYLWSARAMGAGRWRCFVRVLLPASLPLVFSGLRIAVGLTFIVLFAAELLGAQSGLGFLLTRAESGVRFDMMFAAIVTFAAAGFAADRLLLAVRARMLRGQMLAGAGAEL